MKIIQPKQINFQKFYASEFMTLLSFVVTIEIFCLVMIFFGGGK